MKCSCALADESEQTEISKHAQDCARRIAFDEAVTSAFVLTHQRVMCPLHALPFRDEWPRGVVIFTVAIVKYVTAIDGIWDEARELANAGPDAELGIKALEPVLDRRAACCRVTPNELVAVYEETKIGVKRHCKFCGIKRMGTPVQATNLGRVRHACFVCMSTASARPFDVH